MNENDIVKAERDIRTFLTEEKDESACIVRRLKLQYLMAWGYVPAASMGDWLNGHYGRLPEVVLQEYKAAIRWCATKRVAGEGETAYPVPAALSADVREKIHADLASFRKDVDEEVCKCYEFF